VSRINRTGLLGLGAEFLLVFLSVALALVADDWRTTRDQTQAVEGSLNLVVRDLERDLDGLRRLKRALELQDEAGLRLLSLVESDATEEELSEAANMALGWYVFRPSYTAFRGLEQTGQLRLIDAEIRDALVNHYDNLLAYLEQLKESEEVDHEHASQLAERHFRWVSADPPQFFKIVAAHSAAEMRDDTEFLGAVGKLASQRRWLNYRVSGVREDDLFGFTGNFMGFTEQLVAELEDHLRAKTQ
jgi:hypothetical protein